MKPSTEDKVSGKIHEVKGKIKEKVGQLTNNPDLETEGQDEKIDGKVQRKSARWRKSSENSVDSPAWGGWEPFQNRSASTTLKTYVELGAALGSCPTSVVLACRSVRLPHVPQTYPCREGFFRSNLTLSFPSIGVSFGAKNRCPNLLETLIVRNI
jgi:uncharacterized protein YjbJ (UPF0337 family)